MDLSGIIFVVLALAWAVYLVPKAVKHHEDVERTRSVDRFSNAMRVLGQREAEGETRVFAGRTHSTERVVVPSGSSALPEGEKAGPPACPRTAAARRAAARSAARRRRRVTLVLLACDLVVVALASLAVVPWWSVAVPSTLTVLFLALCRREVRRENDALWAPRAAGASASTPPRRAVRVDTAYGAMPAAVDQESSEEDTVPIPVDDMVAVPVAAETPDGGSLWDPLPVTLPTYVHKARASRTVRTIDLGAPGAWTSGRDNAESARVEDQAGQEPVEESVQDHRRAVGS